MRIGNITLPPGAGLAPMAGVGDAAFRVTCKKQGAAYTVSEMVSAKGLLMSEKRSAPLLVLSAEERPAAIQLFGAAPDELCRAAEIAMNYSPDVIDINMGCPVPKVVGGGAGSAIMRTPSLAGELVRAVRRGCGDAVPVTAKIRKGFAEETAVETAKQLEAAGAAMIAVHARLREEYYRAGTVDLTVIKRVKDAVSVPVAGNGDVTDAESFQQMLNATGCDLVLIGRGALGNPFVFSAIAEYLRCGRVPPPPPLETRLAALLSQIALAAAYKGERVALREARTHAAHYLKGIRGAAEFRRRAGTLSEMDDLKRLCEDVLKSENLV